jgi:hypothetical protein
VIHRPYPNPDRALRQLDRHARSASTTPSFGGAQFAEGLAALAKAGWTARDLTRHWQGMLGAEPTRPRGVGGGQ